MGKKHTASSFLKMCIMGMVFSIAGLSCKTEYSPITTPSVADAEFIPASGNFVNDYYVRSTNDPYLIPVGLTNKSSSDRTINFTATSKTAVAGQQYTAPLPVTVKAGKVIDTLRFKGMFSGYGAGRKDTVTIRFSGYPAINGQDSIRLVLQGYCDVVGSELIGSYGHTYDIAGTTKSAPYATALSNWTSTGATTATATIANLALSPDVLFGGAQAATDPVVTGLTLNFDWTDPANFKVYIPAQNFIMKTFSYGVSTIKGAAGANGLAGTFSSCSQTFTITYSVTVSAGSFGTFTTTIAR